MDTSKESWYENSWHFKRKGERDRPGRTAWKPEKAEEAAQSDHPLFTFPAMHPNIDWYQCRDWAVADKDDKVVVADFFACAPRATRAVSACGGIARKGEEKIGLRTHEITSGCIFRRMAIARLFRRYHASSRFGLDGRRS
jgi:hypothetical protein